MILPDRIAHGVAAGDVRCAYRRWQKPRVTAGSTLLTVAGIVRIDAVSTVESSTVTDDDARAAGYASRTELLATFRGTPTDPVFLIELSWVGADPRDALADTAELAASDVTDIDVLLDRLDARVTWARPVLAHLADEPGATAAHLAARLDMDKDALKRRIRKLKEHGLTRSLSTGYELSPRGRAYLSARNTGTS
ncbi:hypothetical protein BJF85_08740 [Saccharomonospora sp. CUA-673]|uniref:helix-turn-helix domain-containing protein n=1 Tax=Saccharomonospora sp. CUA-673 TaxID=1904969 RepID=UPI0009674BCD|nr:helix-turn-helix domain-containing protein [Saccharomonospora sp. CUA-673]OLT38786.1 hypothetical protein BJF85_08740 [Saccharomonospora sp. CUA-673]